jgi:hypothetical protein
MLCSASWFGLRVIVSNRWIAEMDCLGSRAEGDLANHAGSQRNLAGSGITYKGIRKQRYTKQGIRKQGIRSKVYLTTQPNCGRNTPLEFLTGT